MSHEPKGQGESFARLVQQARSLRMHHGVLLTGPQGIGKSMAAEYLARALLCSGDDPMGPCGGCPPCAHFASHPDLLRVGTPEAKDEIPVDLVRGLRQSLQRHSVEGRARVVIVDPADRLNIQGQNALLKTLEEPGRRAFLLLPTRRPEGLLPTVRSRVSELRLLPLPDETIQRTLAEDGVADPADWEWATTHAEGRLGWARTLLNGELRPLFALVEGFVHDGRGTSVTVARAALEGVSGPIPTLQRALLVLCILRTILRKELLATLADDSTGPYAAATSVQCTTQIESLFDAESDLSSRIPPEQVLTHALASVVP